MHATTLQKIALALSALVAALGLVELAVRLLRPETTRTALLARLEGQRDAWRRPDPLFHHVGDGIFALRFAGPHASGRRVLIVGDSFAMGHGVGEEARFGAVLGRDLDGQLAVDVLATSSYSPIVYRNIVRRALAETRYAALAVFVDQTDPADDAIYRNDLLPGENAREFDVERMRDRAAWVDGGLTRIARELSSPLRGSATFNLLRPPPALLTELPSDNPHYRYVELSLSRPQLIHLFTATPRHEFVRVMEGLLYRHLDEIRAICRKHGVPLLLGANPWEPHVSPDPRAGLSHAGPYPIENRLERLLVERYGAAPNVVVLDLTRAFRETSQPSDLFLERPRNEIHWNEAGHRVVAGVLRTVLVERLLDPQRSKPGEALARSGGSRPAVGLTTGRTGSRPGA